MPRCHLSQSFLASLPKETSTRLTHFMDDELPGFMLEYRPNGRGTWYFRYRDDGGALRFFRIGTLADVSVLEARMQAYELYRRVQEGDDPKKDLHYAIAMPTFDEFVACHYLPHAKLKKRSWEVDARLLRLHVLSVFGKAKLNRIQRLDVIAWQNKLRESGLAPGSCNRILSLFKYIFNCAVRWGILEAEKNPCRNVTPFEENTPRERFLTPQEARRLLEELDTLPHKQGALALKLLLFTGARKSEVLSARWEHVDLEHRRLTIPLSKSGRSRHIPLSDRAVQIIQTLPRREETPWLFPASKGDKPLRSLFHLWDTIRKRVGLHDVRIHDLRHSFASFLVNAGCSLYEVQKILGHYDPKVTMRYAHLAQSSLVRAANMVELSVEEHNSED